jgi:hypothetical protein
MTQPDNDAQVDVTEMLAAAGIEVTEEGKARARAELDAAEARWTSEQWDELRRQVGMPS